MKHSRAVAPYGAHHSRRIAERPEVARRAVHSGDRNRLAAKARSSSPDEKVRCVLVPLSTRRYRFEHAPAYAWESSEAAGGNQIIAPMPGRIVVVKAKPGDTVEQGQDLLVMEAMKMELALKAPRAGTLAEITAAQGDFVEADTVLVRFVE